MSKIVKTEYGNTKNILLAPNLAYAVPVVVLSTGVDANAEGKKIIKAGTILGGATSVLTTPTTKLTVVTDATAQGVLLYDIDVTSGEENATMLVAGVVDSSKIADFSTVAPAVATAKLPHIIFRNGEYD